MVETATQAALVERLEHLERAQRRLGRLIVCAALVLTSAFLMGAKGERAVEATSFRLVDEQGRVRILMTVSSGLSFLDEEGRGRAILGVNREGPGLALYGDAGKSGAILNVNKNGPALAFAGENGTTRAILAALRKEGAGLVLYNEQGEERAGLAVREEAGMLALADAKGQSIWSMPP